MTRLYEEPGPNVTHGCKSTYDSYGCRCDPCTDENTRVCAEQRADRTARLLADPTLAPHGKESTYSNWGCKCEPCKAAGSRRNARDKKRRDELKRKYGKAS